MPDYDDSSESELETLLQLALQGDRSAQETLYYELTPVIQWEVGKMLRKWGVQNNLREEIRDMIQDVWTEIYRKDIKVFRDWRKDKLPLKAWVGYFAKIRTAQMLRSPRSPLRELPIADDAIPELGLTLTPEQETLSKDYLYKLYLCLIEHLKPKYLNFFEARFRDEEPLKKIAEMLKVNVETLYTWTYRLKNQADDCRGHLA